MSGIGLKTPKKTMKKSEAILILTVILLAINASIGMFYLSGKIEAYTMKKDEVISVEKRYEQLQSKFRGYERLLAISDNLSFRRNRILSSLPDGVFHEDILYDISENADVNSISIDSLLMDEQVGIDQDRTEQVESVSDTDSNDGFKKGYLSLQTVNIDFSGQIDGIYNFIHDLEKDEQMITLSNLSLTPGFAKKLSGRMTLSFLACEDGLLQKSVIDLPESFGKKNPFRPYKGYSGLSIDAGKANLPDSQKVADFLIQIPEKKAGVPSFIMGPYDQVTKELYSSKSTKTSGYIKITEEGEQIFIKYGFDNNIHKTAMFDKQSDEIIIEIHASDKIEIEEHQQLVLEIQNDSHMSIDFRRVNDPDKKLCLIKSVKNMEILENEEEDYNFNIYKDLM
ncbi:hypothetical protein [Fusibacter sp. JL216-2]|uniref:hypothetical protein n=1 Tax=Fusibacter sp. JL216-2 TaxID=3071453 RepID=UPI003D350415